MVEYALGYFRFYIVSKVFCLFSVLLDNPIPNMEVIKLVYRPFVFHGALSVFKYFAHVSVVLSLDGTYLNKTWMKSLLFGAENGWWNMNQALECAYLLLTGP